LQDVFKVRRDRPDLPAQPEKMARPEWLDPLDQQAPLDPLVLPDRRESRGTNRVI